MKKQYFNISFDNSWWNSLNKADKYLHKKKIIQACSEVRIIRNKSSELTLHNLWQHERESRESLHFAV